MMPSSDGAEHKASSSIRPRHQISRSISELSPMHMHRHHHSSSHHGSHSRHPDKRERASDRDDQIQHTRSAGPAAILQPRSSLEVPSRWEAADTPRTLSPDQSRRTSILVTSGDEQMGPGQGAGVSTGGSGATLYTRKLSRDEELQLERQKAELRARLVSSSSIKPSFR